MGKVRHLPPSMGIMVVDAEGFSKYNDVQQRRLVGEIPSVLESAANACGAPELWSDRRFPDSTGDGYIVGIDESMLPFVVNSYMYALQAELRELNDRLRGEGIRLRLRMSLNTGPVDMIEDLRLDGPPGVTMIDTHRLVDCEALRVLLKRSNPDATCLVAALSESVMAKAVRTGYAARFEEEFVATPVAIEAKDFCGTAYLHVPTMSGDLLRHGLLGVQPTSDLPTPTESDTPAEISDPTPAVPSQSISDSTGAAVNVGHAGGDVTAVGRDQDNSTTVNDHGSHNSVSHTDVGRDLNQSSDVVHGDKYASTNQRGHHGRFFGPEAGDS
ncbi:hypothetical protein [Stackebrandtia soli]|uniref:hypothetical protein n=1 Tax=Stackebrandtia soli TaxID=1892856 RepID=UPI0039EC4A09